MVAKCVHLCLALSTVWSIGLSWLRQKGFCYGSSKAGECDVLTKGASYTVVHTGVHCVCLLGSVELELLKSMKQALW